MRRRFSIARFSVGGERIGVPERGSGIRLVGCGGRKVVQYGRDIHVLLHGGGGELV